MQDLTPMVEIGFLWIELFVFLSISMLILALIQAVSKVERETLNLTSQCAVLCILLATGSFLITIVCAFFDW